MEIYMKFGILFTRKYCFAPATLPMTACIHRGSAGFAPFSVIHKTILLEIGGYTACYVAVYTEPLALQCTLYKFKRF